MRTGDYAYRQRSSRVPENYFPIEEAQIIVAQDAGFGSWQKLMEALAAGAPPPPEPCPPDPAVVDDDEAARGEERREVSDRTMLDRAECTIDDHQPRVLPLGRRRLGDEVLRHR